MNHERAGQFLVEAAIALMDADLNRAVEQLEEALAREAWISGFFMQGTCPQGSPVEVSTGSTSAVSEGQADIELTGVRYGVPVLLRAWLNEESCAEKGIDDPGSVFGELIRIFAKRLGSQYLVGRAGERELADAVGALSHDFRTLSRASRAICRSWRKASIARERRSGMSTSLPCWRSARGWRT